MQQTKSKALHQRTPSSDAYVTKFKKHATLSPYISEIEKRKKMKSVLKQNRRRNGNQSSSRSFRIKEKSTTSLQRAAKQDNTTTIHSFVNKPIHAKKDQKRGRRQISVERHYHPSAPSTLEQKTVSQSLSQNKKLFQQLYVKVQNKAKKEQSFRKGMYQPQREMKIRSREATREEVQIGKYGYTDTNRMKETIVHQKKTEQMGRKNYQKNFRKNKYQVLYSSMASNPGGKQQKHQQPSKSENTFNFHKKQSNLSLNKQMDQLAQKQMQRFYRNLKQKNTNKSLEKSTEKYFKQEQTYRPLKSNNDIEIFVSTVKNPSIQKISNASTLNTSEKNNEPYVSSIKKEKQQSRQLFQYEFDFKEQGCITEMENPSEEESMSHFVEDTQFEKQRKAVEREYFQKNQPQVEWSEEDCKIDLLS